MIGNHVRMITKDAGDSLVTETDIKNIRHIALSSPDVFSALSYVGRPTKRGGGGEGEGDT
jgi:hypothetical protein